MKKKQVFYVFQNFQLDCACSDLNKMQELVLDYSGTEWENGFPFRNKRLTFLHKSQLKAPNQAYVIAFFDYREEKVLMDQLTQFYQKCQSAFPQVYFIVCLNNITISQTQVIESLKKSIYYFNELNIVEDMDGLAEHVLSQPIYNPGPEYAEDEDFDTNRSACFLFGPEGRLIEAHANAMDCRKTCCDLYNYGGWPVSVQDGIIEVAELDPMLQVNGKLIRMYQKVQKYRTGQNIIIYYLDSYAKEFYDYLTQIQQIEQVYTILYIKDLGQRSYEDLKPKLEQFNVIQDEVQMPQPRQEMVKEGQEPPRRAFISAWVYSSDLQQRTPANDLVDLNSFIELISQSNNLETDREADDQLLYSNKFVGINQKEQVFRGQKFTYVQRATEFVLPPAGDDF